MRARRTMNALHGFRKLAVMVGALALAITALPALLFLALCAIPFLAFMVPLAVMSARGTPWAPPHPEGVYKPHLEQGKLIYAPEKPAAA
jgi:hypothetical protein